MWRQLLQGSEWAELIELVSPSFFDVLPARDLRRQIGQLAIDYFRRGRFERTRDALATSLAAGQIPVRMDATGGATAETGGTAAETGGTAGTGATATDTYAIIIKAAGYIGQAGPDTLSEATTEPYNTHVFADVLAEHLTELGVIVQVVNWVDCEDLSCVQVPDASSTASIVVFAGVTYNGALPQELRDLIPILAGTSPAPVVTSALTSCGMGPGVDDFVAELVAAGITTIPGVALQADSGSTLTDEEMHSVLTAFAQSLVAAASA